MLRLVQVVSTTVIGLSSSKSGSQSFSEFVSLKVHHLPRCWQLANSIGRYLVYFVTIYCTKLSKHGKTFRVRIRVVAIVLLEFHFLNLFRL